MSDAQGTDGSTSAGGQTIGQRLAAAREARGLDIRVVANELHLDPGVVEALERDDDAALPAAIFVKGYLRSYARLVGLPEDEIVNTYAAQTGEPPPLNVVAVKGRKPLVQLPSGRWLRNIIVIILAVILLWLAWPYVDQVLRSRGASSEAPEPGRLELPPPERQTLQ